MFWRFLTIASLFVFSAYALDEQDCLTTPYFKDEVQNLLRARIRFYESSLSAEVAEGARQGFMMPWLGAMALGGYIAAQIHDPKEAMGVISTGFNGGMCACICLSPLAFIAALPMSVVSASMSTVKWLIAGVNAAKQGPVFDQEVSEHLYQWMLLIKRGRILLEKALKEHQLTCQNPHRDGSFCETVSCCLKNNNFYRNFAGTSFSEDDLSRILSNVPADQDTPEHLFRCLSNRVLLKDLNDVRWRRLKERLAVYMSRTDKKELTVTEIEEYICFALYFFTLKTQSLGILKTYLR